MHVDHLGIHDSVDGIFPPTVLLDDLDAVDPEVSVVSTADDLEAVDAVVTLTHRDAFLDHVDWVHSVQAGVDRFPLAEFRDRGVALTNSSGIHTESVGETVAGYMLSFARRLHVHRDNQNDANWSWPDWDDPFTLFEEPVTVVGLGALGEGVAQRADGLGMRVSGVRRTPARVPHTHEVYTPDRLHDAIRDARFVVVTLPLTDDTRGTFGAAEFDAMRDDAYFVNVGRGPIVQQDALVDALQTGGIAGAALDVFEEEPLPEDSPLWDMEHVIVSPHCAAAKRTYYEDVADLVRGSLQRLATGDDLVNRVV